MNRLRKSKWQVLHGLGLGGAVFFYVLHVFVPALPALPIYIPDADVIYMTPHPYWRFPLLFAGPFCWLASLLAARRLPRSPWTPLAALPLLLLPYAAPELLPPDVPANLLFWGSLLLPAWSLARWISSLPEPIHTHRAGLVLLFALTVSYTLAGTFVSGRIGEHYVDEGHYLIQAESLHQDRDLNIRNNFGFDVDEVIARKLVQLEAEGMHKAEARMEATKQVREYLHVGHRSPDDRWFSWHPFGISLLLAPAMEAPLWVRQATLALIAALGVWFAYLLCVQTGGSPRWSLVVCLLWGLSTFQVVYSIRALPEALGATLFAGAMLCMLQGRRTPVASLLLLVACAAFTVLAHPRFLPCVGLAGAGLYLRIFVGRPPRRAVTVLYLALPLLGLLAILVALVVHPGALERVTAYPLRNVFGVYPPGRWLILFSERGLLFAFPGSVVFIIGTAYAAATDKTNRVFFLVSALVFLGMVLVMGAVESWDGGPTMYGRYLFVTFPALAPGAVLLTERTTKTGRFWSLLLLLFSASFTVLCLLNFPSIGRAMLHEPWRSVRSGLPLLSRLFFPYEVSDIMIGKPYYGLATFTTNLFPVVLLLASIPILLPGGPSGSRTRRRTGAGMALAVLAGAWSHCIHGRAHPTWTPVEAEARLANALTPGAEIRGSHAAMRRLLSYANRFETRRPLRYTTRKDDIEAGDTPVVRQEQVDVNDWEGRGYRWLTLNRPDHPGLPGPRFTRLVGRLDGGATLHLAIRQGNQTLLEEAIQPPGKDGRFSISRTVDLSGFQGHLYYLVRLEGEGTAHIDRLVWRPELASPPIQNPSDL